jgi:hypothetical protein
LTRSTSLGRSAFIWLAVAGVIGGLSGAVAGPYRAFGKLFVDAIVRVLGTSRVARPVWRRIGREV